MNIFWFGDFRTRQLKYCKDDLKIKTHNFKFFTSDAADYSWLKEVAHADIARTALTTGVAVISTGLVDCVYSCAWPSYDIESYAKKYVTFINTLVVSYPGIKFTVCSVNPVTADYPFTDINSTGFISKTKLNEAITKFNKIIATSDGNYLDTTKYLNTIKFETRDGSHYTFDTCKVLLNYTLANLSDTNVEVSDFEARKVAPAKGNPLWVTTAAGGKNKCCQGNGVTNGSVLPNCVGYAWGRFYEITGTVPKLSTGNANTFYSHKDGYSRSKTVPVRGAVCVWGIGSAGHVAIVEKVNTDSSGNATSIDISESHWYSKVIFDYKENQPAPDWGYTNFLGFIYPPTVKNSSTSKAKVDSILAKSGTKNGVKKELDQQIIANYIWQYLGTRGWTKNAVAGLLGNIEQECGFNARQWERANDTTGGIGLVQWTPGPDWKFYPKNPLLVWSKNNNLDPYDIDTQLKLIEFERTTDKDLWRQWFNIEEYDPARKFWISWNTYIKITEHEHSAAWMAEAFLLNYERPGKDDEGNYNAIQERKNSAEKWFKALSNNFSATEFQVINARLDSCTPTVAATSLIIYNGKSCHYSLTTKNKTVIKNATLKIKNGLNTVNFTKLVPNTSYTATFEIAGDTKSKKITKPIKFKTPQSYPDPVSSIKLTKNTNGNYKLEIRAPKKLGYWKTYGSGYTISLIVNGYQYGPTTNKNNADHLVIEDLNLKTYFGYGNYNPEDIIQIGVQPWTNDGATKIYTQLPPECSSAITRLKKPDSVYLKI